MFKTYTGLKGYGFSFHEYWFTLPEPAPTIDIPLRSHLRFN